MNLNWGFDHGADTWPDLIGSGFYRVDNADCARSRPDPAVGSRSKGSGVMARGQTESTSPGWSPEHGGAKLLHVAGGFGKRRGSPDVHKDTAKLLAWTGGRGASGSCRNRSPKMMPRLGLVGEKRETIMPKEYLKLFS